MGSRNEPPPTATNATTTTAAAAAELDSGESKIVSIESTASASPAVSAKRRPFRHFRKQHQQTRQLLRPSSDADEAAVNGPTVNRLKCATARPRSASIDGGRGICNGSATPVAERKAASGRNGSVDRRLATAVRRPEGAVPDSESVAGVSVPDSPSSPVSIVITDVDGYESTPRWDEFDREILVPDENVPSSSGRCQAVDCNIGCLGQLATCMCATARMMAL